VSGRSDRALGPAGPDVLIVGAGQAGLSAAAELRRLGVAPVLVVDREREPGGIPRHCHHGGFGLQDLRRSMSGPAYARRLARVAADGGARLSLETTVTGIDPTGVVSLVSPSGPAELRPLVVLLATGARAKGPLTYGGGQSSVIGIVAAGNLVHPAETAGVAALGGRRVAQRLAGRLDRGDLGRAFDGVEVQVDEPLAWTWPGIVRPDDIPDRILLRTRAFTGRRTVRVEQAGRVLGRARLRHATPNRSLSIPGGWVADVDVLAGPVVLRLV